MKLPPTLAAAVAAAVLFVAAGIGMAVFLRAWTVRSQSQAAAIVQAQIAVAQTRADYERLRARLRDDAFAVRTSCNRDDPNTALFAALSSLGPAVSVRSSGSVAQGAVATTIPAPARSASPQGTPPPAVDTATLDVAISGRYPDVMRAIASLGDHRPPVGVTVAQITRADTHSDLIVATVHAALIQPTHELCAEIPRALRLTDQSL